jgi:hypothetical protein
VAGGQRVHALCVALGLYGVKTIALAIYRFPRAMGGGGSELELLPFAAGFSAAHRCRSRQRMRWAGAPASLSAR